MGPPPADLRVFTEGDQVWVRHEARWAKGYLIKIKTEGRHRDKPYKVRFDLGQRQTTRLFSIRQVFHEIPKDW